MAWQRAPPADYLRRLTLYAPEQPSYNIHDYTFVHFDDYSFTFAAHHDDHSSDLSFVPTSPVLVTHNVTMIDRCAQEYGLGAAAALLDHIPLRRTRSISSLHSEDVTTKKPKCGAMRSVYHPLSELCKLAVPPRPSNWMDHFEDGKLYYEHVGDVGKHLIDRAFPLLGTGTTTLCFALTTADADRPLVAKVPHNLKHRRDKGEEDRERDVGMSIHFPLAFAKTELVSVCDVGVFIENMPEGINESYVRQRDMYVQERLSGILCKGVLRPTQPLVRKACCGEQTREKIEAHAQEFARMRRKNPDLEQFGYDREGFLRAFDYR